MHWEDLAIILLYLAGVVAAGAIWARGQRSARDYFLGGKEMSWWAVGMSIVASETSTLTFISVPGLAYQSQMHFLQLVFGYFLGRVLVSVIFIPAYYRGDLETAYDFLGRRFGIHIRRLASSVFIITRVLASGVRLFATAIPLHLMTGLSYTESILVIGGVTLTYTYLGGLKAVVAMDVLQLCVYLAGAFVSAALILHALPHGWADVVASAASANKFEIVNWTTGGSVIGFLSSPYTLAGGLVGGTFLTMASHGTDQLLVQRLLGCRSARDAQKALMLDASLIVLQFAFFLLLGLCLYAFYGGRSYGALGLASSDEVFPKFIVEQLPRGLSGVVVAGVLASAMGSLSSSISSLASSSYLDILRQSKRAAAIALGTEMRISRLLSLLWGAALIAGAMLFAGSASPVVEIGLKIASFTYGGLLGTFFLGLLFAGADERDATIGFLAGICAMCCVIMFTTIDYTWHTLVGCTVTVCTGNLSARIRMRRKSAPQA
ncbi:MAG TPA: sodium:solute symporter [Bacteroidota bacterium]|nr:sodium:solute symporter [Bacteroidota bacterium]